jgi:hypothetical protein
METLKTAQAKATPKSPDPVPIDARNPVPGKPPQTVEFLPLSIEEKIDRGNDPYNNTGEQILLKLRKDDQQ